MKVCQVGKFERTPETRRKISIAAKKRTKEKNPFYGKRHSEKSKQKICLTKTGIARNEKQRKEHRRDYAIKWIKAHPERIKELSKVSSGRFADPKGRRTR